MSSVARGRRPWTRRALHNRSGERLHLTRRVEDGARCSPWKRPPPRSEGRRCPRPYRSGRERRSDQRAALGHSRRQDHHTRYWRTSLLSSRRAASLVECWRRAAGLQGQGGPAGDLDQYLEGIFAIINASASVGRRSFTSRIFHCAIPASASARRRRGSIASSSASSSRSAHFLARVTRPVAGLAHRRSSGVTANPARHVRERVEPSDLAAGTGGDASASDEPSPRHSRRAGVLPSQSPWLRSWRCRSRLDSPASRQ